MQSPNLSIIDVRDLIAGTKAELKKADDWTTLVNFYESTKDLAAGMDPPMEPPKLERASRRGLKHLYVTDEQREQLLLVQYVASIHKKLLQVQHRGPGDGQPHGEGHDRCGCRRISSRAAREYQLGHVQG